MHWTDGLAIQADMISMIYLIQIDSETEYEIMIRNIFYAFVLSYNAILRFILMMLIKR